MEKAIHELEAEDKRALAAAKQNQDCPQDSPVKAIKVIPEIHGNVAESFLAIDDLTNDLSDLIKRYCILGGLLVTSGGIMLFLGIRGIKLFFEIAQNTRNGYSLAAVARGLVLPHVITLAGLASITFGMILLTKALFFIKHIRSATNKE